MRLIHSLLLTVTLVAGLGAQAEPVRCMFTEPFYEITVDAQAKTVTFLDAIENKTTVYPILLKTQDEGTTRVEWGAGAEARVLEYTRDPRGGSDGMSDFVFPYAAATWVAGPDSHLLVGGCDTPSEPAVNTSEAPFPGCYEALWDQYEDGASYYKGIGEKITGPLIADPKTKGLGLFLESALVVRGYMELSFDLCRSIDEAVK